jgi:hypothetical protein
MSALPRYDFAPWSLSEAVVADLVRKGAHLFEAPLEPGACAALADEIQASRRFDHRLFLAECEVATAPAGAGFGALARLKPRLEFLERSPQVAEALWSLLGPDYRIVEKTVVCQLPTRALPAWVKRRLDAEPGLDLARFVRPQFRDLAYVCGAEVRQDPAIDPERPADAVTLGVILDPVTVADAPLHILEGSHRMGAAAFPHDLRRTEPGSLRYRNGDLGDVYVTERLLTGEAGAAALWHAFTLHGAPALTGDAPRLSLRVRAARGDAVQAGIDSVNATLAGPLRLDDAAPAPPAPPAERPRWGAFLGA